MSCGTQEKAQAGILLVIEKNDPNIYEWLENLSSIHLFRATSQHLEEISLTSTEFPFKPQPAGGGFNACYFIAELNYAANIYLCSLITNPNLRKQCESNAKKSYCDAYDLCGEPS